MLSYRKVMYYAPLVLILKCLCDYTDEHIYQHLTQGHKDDYYFTRYLSIDWWLVAYDIFFNAYSRAVQNMLRELHEEKLNTHLQCKIYLGKMFKHKMNELAPWISDLEIADFIINRCLLIHLDNHEDKFNLLCFMTRKLFDVVQDKCKVCK